MKLKTLVPIIALLSLPLSVIAAPVTYPGPVAVDDTGAVVFPTSITVASVTDLDGNAIAAPGAFGHIAGPNICVVYDAVAKGEAWITLTPVMSGHTFVNSPPRIFASIDPSNISTGTTNTGTLITGQATISGKTNLIATNAMDSPNEATAQGTLLILSKRTLNRQTYNPATKVLQLLNDDGTNYGPSLTLTIDANNNITAR